MSLALRSSIIAAALILPMTAGTAFAQAARDTAVKALEAGLKAAGATDIVIPAPAGDDARFSLKGIKAKLPVTGDDGLKDLAIASITYSGVKAAPEGYTADEILIEGLSASSAKDIITANSVKVTGYSGKSATWIAANPGKNGEVARAGAATGILISADGRKIPVASAGYTADNFVNGVPYKVSWTMNGLVVPVDPKDDDMKDIAALGYTQIALDSSGTSAYDPATAKVAITDVMLQGKDIGTFKLSWAMSNVTPDAIEQLKTVGDDTGKLMGILQGFSFDSLSIRIENASLADRLLDRQAKEAGVPRDALVQQFTMMAPMMLSSINNKAFEKKVSDAITAFLKSPKSLTATAKPAAPVPVAQIVGTAMVAPQSIPDVLAVDVKANN